MALPSSVIQFIIVFVIVAMFLFLACTKKLLCRKSILETVQISSPEISILGSPQTIWTIPRARVRTDVSPISSIVSTSSSATSRLEIPRVYIVSSDFESYHRRGAVAVSPPPSYENFVKDEEPPPPYEECLFGDNNNPANER